VRRKGGTKITKTSLVPFVPFRGSSAIVPPTITIGRSAQEVLGSHRLQKFDARTITTSTGAPLPVAIKNPLSRSFSIDLTPIRVHTDAHAQLTVRKLNTRAFTYANHIFLGPGESPRDLRLMAHEVAHVVQQSRGAVLQHFTTTHADVFEHEAERASAAVMRGEKFNVQQRAHPRPQGLFGLSLPNPLTWLANRVNSIPGFRMLTIILGMNPVNGEAVPRTAANILRALVEFIPGGTLITQALDNYGIFDRVGAFVEEQINSLAMTAGAIGNAVTEFISSLSPSDILNLGGVWDRAVRIFTTPIDRIISLGRRLVTRIVQFIKDAILQPLAQLASQTRGWDLLIAVLGRNPITGEAVPRNAETLIGGFMRLIGQEEVWTNLQRARAVPRAWAWFQGALSGLLNFVSQIPTLFMQALRSLELVDIVVLPRAFVRVGSVFGNFVVQFISWAGQQVFSLLQIIFEVLAPLAMPYIRRATSALRTIFSDPVGFVGNLVRAGIQGFRQFGSNFLTHLRTSLIGWLTGTLSGANIYIPQAFNLREIIKFVLSVLGLTWQNIRTKLVRAIGETATSALETGFEIVTTLITEGPAAAWEQIREGISNLREMVMEQIMTFVRDRIVVAAITRLVTSLNPAGAFIQAVIATYNTIMFFVERLRQIMQVVMAFIDSMAAIASGNITAAANRVEQTMAGMLTLVISFLARLVGLGRVSDAVRNIINRIRAPIDRALDRVVAWIVRQARRLGRAIAEAGLPRDPQQRLRMGLNAAVSAIRRLPGNQVGRALLNPILSAVRTRYGFTSLEPQIRNGRWWIQGTINPTGGQDGEKEAATGPPRVDANVNQDFLVKRVTFLHARVLRKDDATQQLELKHVYDDRRVTLTYDEFNTEIAQPRSVVVRAFDAVRWGNSRYKELAADDRILIESGREFSGTQKANIRDKNRQLNGGQLLSDQSRTPLVDPVRAVSRGMAARTGTTYTGVPPNQAQVDHVHPKDGGGYNSYANAEVLSERENQAKRNR
jgi:5-methylcytosine-specific restriction endonuclease McrA